MCVNRSNTELLNWEIFHHVTVRYRDHYGQQGFKGNRQ